MSECARNYLSPGRIERVRRVNQFARGSFTVALQLAPFSRKDTPVSYEISPVFVHKRKFAAG